MTFRHSKEEHWRRWVENQFTQNATFAGSVVITDDLEIGGTFFIPTEETEGVKFGDIATGTYGWEDITSEIKARGVGSTDPAWAIINGSAFSAYSFAVGDKVWMNFHIPHNYAKGTDLYLHAHWLPDGTNTNSVKWQFTYSYAHGHNQAAFALASPTVITAEQTVGGTQYQHYVTETAAVTITDCEPDGILSVAIERITNGGTNNTNGIFLLTADVHYQSTGVPTVNRAPNFYGA